MSQNQKTRINIYLDTSLGESFKRYCRSKNQSYSDVIETLIYRFLISPSSTKTSSITSVQEVQEEVHEKAVKAFHQVYDDSRQEIIRQAIESSGSQQVEEVSPQIPMPIPSPEVNHERPRPRHLSKRSKRS